MLGMAIMNLGFILTEDREEDILDVGKFDHDSLFSCTKKNNYCIHYYDP